jgi:hypothetical protein
MTVFRRRSQKLLVEFGKDFPLLPDWSSALATAATAVERHTTLFHVFLLFPSANQPIRKGKSGEKKRTKQASRQAS